MDSVVDDWRCAAIVWRVVELDVSGCDERSWVHTTRLPSNEQATKSRTHIASIEISDQSTIVIGGGAAHPAFDSRACYIFIDNIAIVHVLDSDAVGQSRPLSSYQT